jgi:hypothetical protein
MSASDPATRQTSVASGPILGNPSSASRRIRKPQEFLLPDGHKILIALPEEAARLRDKYAHHADSPDAVQVEIVIHGSEEHHVHRKQFSEDFLYRLSLLAFAPSGMYCPDKEACGGSEDFFRPPSSLSYWPCPDRTAEC